MNNNTNGILDTRLSQNLVKEFNIPANIEYGEHSPFKIGGGNAIWITHIPPNVKVWFSTNQNKDDAQRLDYMNRGMRYLEIGNEGITRIYDNFYIFTEGTNDNDFIKVCVSTEGANVEPILSSNTNQIDQVDKVGKIETLDILGGLSPQAKLDLNDAIYNIFNPKKLIKQISIQGEVKHTINGFNLIILPLQEKIEGLNIKNDKFYKLEFFGHCDVGSTYQDKSDEITDSSTTIHLCLFNNNNGATFTETTLYDIDNAYLIDKNPWATEKSDLFDIFGLKYVAYWTGNNNIGYTGVIFEDKGLNFLNNPIFSGELINKYENIGLVMGTRTTTGISYMHASLLINLYEFKQI